MYKLSLLVCAALACLVAVQGRPSSSEERTGVMCVNEKPCTWSNGTAGVRTCERQCKDETYGCAALTRSKLNDQSQVVQVTKNKCIQLCTDACKTECGCVTLDGKAYCKKCSSSEEEEDEDSDEEQGALCPRAGDAEHRCDEDDTCVQVDANTQMCLHKCDTDDNCRRRDTCGHTFGGAKYCKRTERVKSCEGRRGGRGRGGRRGRRH